MNNFTIVKGNAKLLQPSRAFTIENACYVNKVNLNRECFFLNFIILLFTTKISH